MHIYEGDYKKILAMLNKIDRKHEFYIKDNRCFINSYTKNEVYEISREVYTLLYFMRLENNSENLLSFLYSIFTMKVLGEIFVDISEILL